jgi:hypothetical protein
MAHFAQLDENNNVIQVIVVDNSTIINSNGIEIEELGIQFCKELVGQSTNWIQTSYNSNFRKNYAGIGFTYDELRDAFIPPKPYPSWILNEDTCVWESPIPYPNNDEDYIWNENNQSWDVNE